jgi:hypothetical protein
MGEKPFQIFSLDKYTFNARLVPALIVLLPVGVSLASLFPEKFAGWDLIVWLVTSMGLAVFLAQLARDRGRSKELELFKQWGGKPSTVMLRYKDSTLTQQTLVRYHEKLRQLVPIKMPTPEEELRDLQKADAVYESCGDFLRACTHDKEKFGLLFEENVNYGFRRNLWGMKSLAIILTVLSILLTLSQVHPNWLRISSIKPVVLVALILDLSFLVIWLAVIKPNWVRTTADAYSKQLLSAIDILESKNAVGGAPQK